MASSKHHVTDLVTWHHVKVFPHCRHTQNSTNMTYYIYIRTGHWPLIKMRITMVKLRIRKTKVKIRTESDTNLDIHSDHTGSVYDNTVVVDSQHLKVCSIMYNTYYFKCNAKY